MSVYPSVCHTITAVIIGRYGFKVTLHSDAELGPNTRTLDNTLINRTEGRNLSINFTHLTLTSEKREYPIQLTTGGERL